MASSDQLEVDSFEGDSAYGDELSTYTSSITSSVHNYPVEHGRRYHAYRSGRYMLPNDDQESERLDIHHALIRKVMEDRLYFAPLGDSIERAIDLGTGTGIWAINFADDHPKAEVIANDLSPTQPTMIPPNLKFLVDDIEDPWGYENAPFDFIHARFLAGAIRDWPGLMKQAYTCTKPGGWVEFQDWSTYAYSQDGSLAEDSALIKFSKLTTEWRKKKGFDMLPGPQLEGWMNDAKFVNVHATKFPLALGPWAKDRRLKEIGMYNLLQLEEGIEGVCLGILTQGVEPWSFEEVQVFLGQLRKEMRDRKIHAIFDL